MVLFFAFSGAECAVTPGGEIRDPSRTVPRGLLGAAAFLIALYCAVQLVSQGVLGPAIDHSGGAPLAAVAERLFGSGGRGLVLACTMLATLGVLAGDLLATPRWARSSSTRLPRSFQRRGREPAGLSRSSRSMRRSLP